MPVWITVAVGTLTALLGGVGTAAVMLYAKWRRTKAESELADLEVEGKKTKIIVDGERAKTDLEIHVRDDLVEGYRKSAADERKRADDAETRANRMIEAANTRANEAEARSDRKDEDCGKRMESLVTRYRERETMQAKQHQEREMQFQGIVDKVRSDLGTEMNTLRSRLDECVQDRADLRGRMEVIESRLDAKDARRRRKDEPEAEGS